MNIQKQREHDMREIGNLVDNYLRESSELPELWTLIVWPNGKGALSNYISNAQRADIIKALRETADRLEQRMDMPPVTTSTQ